MEKGSIPKHTVLIAELYLCTVQRPPQRNNARSSGPETLPCSAWYLPPFPHPEASHQGYLVWSSVFKCSIDKPSVQDIGGF